MPAAVSHVVVPRSADLGDGFVVRRALPAAQRRTVGPFVFFDQMGPVHLPAGRGLDVRPHPHIGLATVTYLFEGEIVHRDSLGSVQIIRPGDVNWMTAGHGIVHSERSTPAERERGAALSGLQVWVALPREHEETQPAFVHHPQATLPALDVNGHRLRVVVGDAFGARSPVQVFAPMFYIDARLDGAGELVLPAELGERAAYVVDGEVEVAGDTNRFAAGRLLVIADGAPLLLRGIGAARVMLFGGAPLDGPRFVWWNFVSSSKERIERAKAEWRTGRFGRVPGDDEAIPLPER